MKYRFEAFDRSGNLVKGDLDAGSQEEAHALIRGRGVVPYLVQTSGASDVLFREISLSAGSRRADEAQLARLTRDLAVLLQAGVPLDAALRIAAATAEDSRMQQLAQKLLDGVLEGLSLARAIEREDGVFRAEYVRIIEAGETSAALGDAMAELADLLDKRVEIRSRIRAALAYPTLLVCLAVVSLWIVLGHLVPAVTPIFLENGMPLPAVIEGLDALRRHAMPILTGIGILIAGVVLAWLAAHRDPALKGKLDRLSLRVPFLGPLAEVREAGRFMRTLGTLIRAGVPPLQALQSSCPLVRNRHTRSRLEDVVTDVRAGLTIGTAMARAAALPPIAQQLVAVGEESGRLQEMLLRAASVLERQEQAKTARALAILTPAVTILVAGMIAAVILSVMGAVLSINEIALQ
jgi:general secretion pathway protein F